MRETLLGKSKWLIVKTRPPSSLCFLIKIFSPHPALPPTRPLPRTTALEAPTVPQLARGGFPAHPERSNVRISQQYSNNPPHHQLTPNNPPPPYRHPEEQRDVRISQRYSNNQQYKTHTRITQCRHFDRSGEISVAPTDLEL